jgi:HAD superfamily hydrolase (TIGR01450 family)
MLRTVGDVLASHKLFLLDNFGVLKRAKGAIPGVERSVAHIRASGNIPTMLSNTANISQEKMRAVLAKQGIDLALNEIVTSGMALVQYFREKNLEGKDVLVVGNNVAEEYVRLAGGLPMSRDGIMETFTQASAVVVGWYPIDPIDSDDRGGRMRLDVMHAAISALMLNPAVFGVNANPDIIAPHSKDAFLFACGALANLIELCSGRQLDQLGKPHRPIYDLALMPFSDVPSDQIVMVGDTLGTDILGAKNARPGGIKSLLVLTGNTAYKDLAAATVRPDFVAESFLPESPLITW